MFKSNIPGLKRNALNDSTLDFGNGGATLAKQTGERAINARLLHAAPVLISVALNVVGQLVLKRGMSDLGPLSLTEHSIIDLFMAIATNVFVIIGAFIYAGSVLFWLVGLSRVPLSYAYPFISLSYVAILAASFFILGEQLNLLRLAGVALICFGVMLVAYSEE
ncbi:EamA family transporter [Candidatus Chlorohelix sp.]|uniref:EamA family transporter n=1 Tax=Candidatus Chlorohelix sp. TaxID=3139201 RepID=UPI00305E9CC0